MKLNIPSSNTKIRAGETIVGNLYKKRSSSDGKRLYIYLRVGSTQTANESTNQNYRENTVPFVILAKINEIGSIENCGPNYSPINVKDMVEELGEAEIGVFRPTTIIGNL